MEKKLGQFLSYAALACGFMTSAFADQAEDQNDTQMNRSSSETVNFREITPNAGPRVTNGVDVFVTADFIYWTSRQEGLAFARSGLADYSEAQAFGNTPCGKTYYPKSKFSPGFKVGVGLNLGHDGWDTYLDYTWFHNSTKCAYVVNSSSYTAPIPLWEVATVGSATAKENFLVLSTFVNVGNSQAHWKLYFNNFDWELGRNFYISQYLTLRPYAGLKGNWMQQYYNVTYSDYLASDISSEIDIAKMHQEQKFWGVGIRTGLDTSWYFDKNWSMFANTALSSLWGRYKVTRQDLTLAPKATSYHTIINTVNDFHTVKPVLELQLGARYDYWFCDDDYHFGIEAAWEQQVWFNQGQFIKYLEPDSSDANLVLQGLTVDFRFDF